MGPGTLTQVLGLLPTQVLHHPELLVGIQSLDDAGVYRLTPDLALIQTVDFFTPIVDDPYLFGQVAAANALSDIYAMGGRPLTAMNIVCFPSAKLDLAILGEILRGGADKLLEAGAVLVGGHSIDDEEPKYGLAVTGIVHPERIITNCGARPGDKLVLTKPLGTGILATALKAELVGKETEKLIGYWMALLSRDAAEAMVEVGAHACTDITGFGLLGHCLELAQGSHVDVILHTQEIPVFPQVLDFAAMGLVPAGAYRNRHHARGKVKFAPGVSEAWQDLLFDPQTSGGLLIAVPPDKATELLTRLHNRGVEVARVIGEVTEGSGYIYVD